MRREVVDGGLILAGNGHSDLVWGHLAIRDTEDRGIWIKRSGIGFEEVAEDDVQLVGWDGALLAGRGSVHIEHHIHTEIMRARPDVVCSVHTHPEAAVTFASIGEPLAAVGHEATLFTPPDIARFTLTGDLIRTRELGVAVAESIGERNALLLVNHGVVVVGSSVDDAVFAAVLLEKACRMQLAAMSAAGGRRLLASSEAEALQKRDRCYSPTQMGHGAGYLRRMSDR